MNSFLAAQYNSSRVLRQLWLNPGISRAEIADRLGLNRSTITHIIKGLADQQIVSIGESGASGPHGGRRNVQLTINPAFGCFAGFDLQPNLLRVVAVDVGGEVLLRKEFKATLSGNRLYSAIKRGYDWLKGRLENDGVRLLGVGCGVPGIVEPDELLIQQSIPLDIHDPEAFGRRLADFISEPILMDNDANCCCWAEILARRSAEPASFLFVFGAWSKSRGRASRDVTAIGMGIAIDDNVHRGKGFSAGEFRSIEWKPGRASQFSMPDDEVASAKTNRKLFLKLTRELARNSALLANVLNLERMYLGGFFDPSECDVRPIFEDEIKRNWSYPTKPACEVLYSTHRELVVAYGAAGLFLDRIFGQNEELVLTGQKAGVNLLTG